MDFQLFTHNLSFNQSLKAGDLYQMLDTKNKKEFILSLTNYRHDVFKTIESFFDQKENKKFIIDLLVDFTLALPQNKIQSHTQTLSQFLINTNIYNKKEKSKVVTAFVNAGLDVNSEVGAEKDISGTPLVHFIAAYCDLNAVKLFVQKGAKLNIIDDEKDSVLSSTMVCEPNIKNLQYLLKQKEINYYKGRNILSLAINKGYNEIVKMLLSTPLVHDEVFMKSAQATCSVENWNTFYIQHEKSKLEKLISQETSKEPKKLKI